MVPLCFCSCSYKNSVVVILVAVTLVTLILITVALITLILVAVTLVTLILVTVTLITLILVAVALVALILIPVVLVPVVLVPVVLVPVVCALYTPCFLTGQPEFVNWRKVLAGLSSTMSKRRMENLLLVHICVHMLLQVVLMLPIALTHTAISTTVTVPLY